MLDLKRLLNIPVAQAINLTTVIDGNASIAMFTSLSDTTALPDRAVLRSSELAVLARREGVTIARADLLPTVSLSFTNGFQAFPASWLRVSDDARLRRQPVLRDRFVDHEQVPEWWMVHGSVDDRHHQLAHFRRDAGAVEHRSCAGATATGGNSAAAVARGGRRRSRARARAELNRARSVFDARQQNSTNAKEAFQLASLRFSRGLSTQLEVSDAQLALLTAESTEARATFDVFLASAELARALGRPIPLPPTTSSSRSSDPGAPREP